jgi:hypothetical protein
MSTPVVPPEPPNEPVFSAAWIVSFAATILTALVAFSVDLKAEQQIAILSVVGFVATGVIAWDASNRRARNKRREAEAMASAIPSSPGDPGDTVG